MIVKFLIALLAAASFAVDVLADGMPIKDGRFVGGPTTVLKLTQAQIVALKTTRMIKVTPAQKARLVRDAGVAASELEVYDTRRHENDCTCHAWNRALRFSETQIEVPHPYLVSDEDAARRQKEVDDID
jgi:hypothetical protein